MGICFLSPEFRSLFFNLIINAYFIGVILPVIFHLFNKIILLYLQNNLIYFNRYSGILPNISRVTMNFIKRFNYPINFIFSGAIAGLVSTIIFTIVHQILITDIWFSFFIMAVAGIVSGISIAGSYGKIINTPSLKNWLGYNFIYILMFILLAVMSIIIFEPVTTAAEIMQAKTRPDELIKRAIPLSEIFTISFSLIMGFLFGKKIIDYIIILLTNSVLMIILGLNVSIIGLVKIPSGFFYLVFELFALIITIFIVYAGVFIIFERKNLRQNISLSQISK